MHGLSIQVSEDEWIDVQVTDVTACRGGLCEHDEKRMEHNNGQRFHHAEICRKVPKHARTLIHEVFMGASPRPYKVRQVPGKWGLSCCAEKAPKGPNGKRSGPNVRNTLLDPCSHMLGLLNAQGRVVVRFRPAMVTHARPTASPLPAPEEVLDPRTLQDDVSTPRPAMAPLDLDAVPPSNRVKWEIHPDGRIMFDGADGATSRLLARHSKRLTGTEPARIMSPQEAFDPRLVAMMVLQAGKDGLTEYDVYRTRVDDLGPDVILDEEQSLRYLELLRPRIDECLHRGGRALVIDQQRLREGGSVVVLASR